jgi:hypothetical protein
VIIIIVVVVVVVVVVIIIIIIIIIIIMLHITNAWSIKLIDISLQEWRSSTDLQETGFRILFTSKCTQANLRSNTATKATNDQGNLKQFVKYVLLTKNLLTLSL